MAALLNSSFFAFTNSFLPKYRVKYYDYIIKWCSGGYNVIGVYLLGAICGSAQSTDCAQHIDGY